MPPTLKELAGKYMREKISTGAWPSGYRLSDLLISREIGVSRTPIREAINQIVAEGLAELRPHEGAFVRTVDRKEIEDLYELREVLECHAARKAAESATPQLIRTLEENLAKIETLLAGVTQGQETLDADQTRQQREADLAFHQAMLQATGNRKLEKIIGDFRLHAQLFTLLAAEMPVASLQNAVTYHRQLLKAVRAGSPQAAEDAMRDHMRAAREQTLARLPQVPSGHEAIPEPLRKFLEQ